MALPSRIRVILARCRALFRRRDDEPGARRHRPDSAPSGPVDRPAAAAALARSSACVASSGRRRSGLTAGAWGAQGRRSACLRACSGRGLTHERFRRRPAGKSWARRVESTRGPDALMRPVSGKAGVAAGTPLIRTARLRVETRCSRSQWRGRPHRRSDFRGVRSRSRSNSRRSSLVSFPASTSCAIIGCARPPKKLRISSSSR
jgi:hypothetical protein